MSKIVTLGVEQEFFLVDPQTGDLRSHNGERDVARLKEALGSRYSQEMLACMVEVHTPIAYGIGQAVEFAAVDRRDVWAAVREIGLLPYSAGSHPDGMWRSHGRSDTARYEGLEREMGLSARSMLYSGLHLHVGVEEPEDRLRVVEGLVPYLPLFLALSSSSPFWQGERSGYASFRSRVQGVLPRTGIPPKFSSWQAYREYISVLGAAEAADPATKMWWDIRPSSKYPTVEIRIADAMPDLAEQACLIALMACITSHIERHETVLSYFDGMPTSQVDINRWLAQRDGTDAWLIDRQFKKRRLHEVMEDVVEALSSTAADLDCKELLLDSLVLARQGTSAKRQLAVYDQALLEGVSTAQALKLVGQSVLEESHGIEDLVV